MPDNIETISREIADYVIEHHLIRQPRSAEDLQHLIMKILEDRHVLRDREEIMHNDTYLISNDSRVFTESRGREEDWAIWVHHKARTSEK